MAHMVHTWEFLNSGALSLTSTNRALIVKRPTEGTLNLWKPPQKTLKRVSRMWALQRPFGGILDPPASIPKQKLSGRLP